MRKSILTACCLLTTGLHTQARAQEDAAAEVTDEAGETEAIEVVDDPAGKVRTGGRETAPGEVHVVARGDTLWDLSQQYLGSPWYWPKVWSYNPEIANPHWIYPGNQVKFFAGGEDAPARVEVAQADTQSDRLGPAGGMIDSGEPSDIVSSDEASNTVEVSGKIGYQQGVGRRIVHEGFVTPREVEEAGVIKASFDEGEMLSLTDEVYLTFNKKNPARVGDRYIIFRSLGKVEHPKSGPTVGYLTQLLGTLRITRLNKNVVTARIDQVFDEINRGDLVGPYGEKLAERVASKPNKVQLEGVVVGALVPMLTMFGEHHVVIIDKGSSHGVEQGNTFTVVRQGDRGGNFLNPSEGQDSDYPFESVGNCMALDVKEKATTCILTRSIREIVKGDRVMMVTQEKSIATR